MLNHNELAYSEARFQDLNVLREDAWQIGEALAWINANMTWKCGCEFKGTPDRHSWADCNICPDCLKVELKTNSHHPVRYGYPVSHPWIGRQ